MISHVENSKYVLKLEFSIFEETSINTRGHSLDLSIYGPLALVLENTSTTKVRVTTKPKGEEVRSAMNSYRQRYRKAKMVDEKFITLPSAIVMA